MIVQYLVHHLLPIYGEYLFGAPPAYKTPHSVSSLKLLSYSHNLNLDYTTYRSIWSLSFADLSSRFSLCLSPFLFTHTSRVTLKVGFLFRVKRLFRPTHLLRGAEICPMLQYCSYVWDKVSLISFFSRSDSTKDRFVGQ